MPYASPSGILCEVSGIAEIGRSSTAYIFCTSHNIQADTSIQNAVTLMDA